MAEGRAPRVVRHPELLNGEWLPLLKDGRRALLWTFIPVPVVTVLGLLAGGQDWTMGLALLAVWLCHVGLVYADRRARMRATDDVLDVRNVRGLHTVQGSQVARVRHQYNGRSPDFQLVLDSGRRVWVPTSRLERGHSTLFTWLDMHAPHAELDRRSQEWRQHMLQADLI